MNVIITFKNNTGNDGKPISPSRVVNVMAILTTSYATKLIQKNNRVQSFENCDIENMFLQDMGK